MYDDGSLAGGLSTGTLLTMSFAVARARPTTHVTATVGDRATLSGVVRPLTTRTTVADSRRDRRRLSATERRREVRSRHHTRVQQSRVTCISCLTCTTNTPGDVTSSSSSQHVHHHHHHHHYHCRLLTLARLNRQHLFTEHYYTTILLFRGWRGGATGKAFGLAISRSRVQILLEATLRNNLRQVVYTYVPLSPSSITRYLPKGGDALRLGR